MVDLYALGRNYYQDSLVVTQQVTRVPVKVDTEDEKSEAPNIGLQHFVPVDLYSHNIASTPGLIRMLHLLQQLEGFGLSTHLRTGLYSFLCVDVKIFWLLFRIMHCYPTFVGMPMVSYFCF